MRLKLAAAIFATSAALTALAISTSAQAETKQFAFSGFKAIEADAGFTIEFTQAPTYSVVVDSKNNNLDLIIIEQVGDTLRIKRPKSTRQLKNVEDIVHISAPDLDALKLHAAIEFNAKKLSLDTLKIEANAAVDIDIADLRVNTLNVQLDAASELKVSGTCSKLTLNLGAATDADTRNLKCRDAEIHAGVASSVHAYASERANASAGMSSTVLISGKPANFTKSTERFGSTVSLED